MEKNEMVKRVKKGKSERGASMVEYALLVALIAVVAMAGVRLLGTNINTAFNGVAGQIIATPAAN
jgi:pilus assembly protein Flp/PilA